MRVILNSANTEIKVFNAQELADVAKLPVLEVLSSKHLHADLTIGPGEVVYDHLAD